MTAYYPSSSSSKQYYHSDYPTKNRFELDDASEETRGRSTVPSFSYTSSSVSTSYGTAGGPHSVYYDSLEEEEGSIESEELIFEMDHEEADDQDSAYTASTETPPTPTYSLQSSSRRPSSPSSYFPRPDQVPTSPTSADPDLASFSFEGGFNRADANAHESLADMLVREVSEEFSKAGEEGANAWATQRLRYLVDVLSRETITSKARGQEEVQATMALLNFFHVNLQISTAWLLPEIRRWRESLFWSGLVESHEAAGDEW